LGRTVLECPIGDTDIQQLTLVMAGLEAGAE
jgi:hypothetical protein